MLLYHSECYALGFRSRWEMDCFEHRMMCESSLFSTLLKRTAQHLEIKYIAHTALRSVQTDRQRQRQRQDGLD